MRNGRVIVACVALAGWIAFEVATDSMGVFVAAQMASYIAFEQLTVANSVKTLTASKITPSGQAMATQAVCRLETAEIRYTVDTTTPTTTVGTLLEPGDTLTLNGHDVLSNFQAIRTGATSGVLACTYTAP